MILAYNINKCCITMGVRQYYHGNTTVSLKSTVCDGVIHLQCEFANSWDLNPHSSPGPLLGSSYQHHNNTSTRKPVSSWVVVTCYWFDGCQTTSPQIGQGLSVTTRCSNLLHEWPGMHSTLYKLKKNTLQSHLAGNSMIKGSLVDTVLSVSSH